VNQLTALVTFFCCMPIALAEETSMVVSDPGLWGLVSAFLPSWLSNHIPVLVALMVAIRGLAEALLILSKWSEKFAPSHLVVAKALSVMAKALAFLGVGMPKAIVLDRADKLKAQAPAAEPEAEKAP